MFRHVRYENLVAGVSGGVLSNLALHPLDLVKIRFAGKSPPTPRAASPAVSPREAPDPQRKLGLPNLHAARRRAPKMMLSTCGARSEDLGREPQLLYLASAFPEPRNPKGWGK